MAAPGPGYGRGGRGAALLKALQEPVRKPGESSPPRAEQQQDAPPPTMAMGRGAMLQHLQMQASLGRGMAAPAATPATTAAPPPMGRGMALSGAMPMGRGMAAMSGMPMGRGMAMAAPATTAPQQAAASAATPAMPTMPMGRGAMAMGRGMGAAPAMAAATPAATPPRQQPSPPGQQPSPPRQQPSPPREPAAAPPAGPAGDGDGDRRLTKLEYMLSKMSTDEAVSMQGTKGQRIDVMANCIPVRCNLRGVFQYAVSFSPQIDSKGMRFHMMDTDQIQTIIGPVRAFDGAILFLPKQLEQDPASAVVKRSTDGADVTVSIKLVRTIPPVACLQVFNVIFRRAMSHLRLVQVGRHYYDCHNPSKIPAHRLEVWPGYITAISETEGGLMLLTDVSHRVLRTETVLDKFGDVYKECRDIDDFHRRASQTVIGVTVLTRYNNKTYRVDDIDWSRNPKSTFQLANGETTSFLDYYQRNYKVVIQDHDQPLLIHRPKQKEQQKRGGRPSLEVICLIPELSHMTGLTDDMRKDFRIMKDLGAHTRVVPHERRQTLRKLCENLASHPESQAELSKWGLSIDLDVVKTYARMLPAEKIIFANDRRCESKNADWGRDATNNRMLTAVNLENWVVIHTTRDSQRAQDFVNMLLQVSPQLGMQVARPSMQKLDNPRTDSYIKALQRCIGPQVQLVVTIFQSSRDDQYAAIKKHCCDTAPIASQVIISRTIGDQRKLRSVTQKIALQVNCKLGGELWAVEIPVKSLMVIGIDVYHDKARQGKSVAGFVASLNKHCTRWFSTVAYHEPGQELVKGLQICLTDALRKYNEENHQLPDRIVIFRDGVGDGQLKVVAGYEVAQLESCFAQFGESYQPKLAMVIVQKRINQKIFAMQRQGLINPPPGTVMDHTITRKEWYDFFLVSQFVRQGTVNPTHYVVVHDKTGWKPDHMQMLTYKLTHLYYNWPGTIRTPAPCQYAHKLAGLVGQCIHKKPSTKLSDRLFFL